jgi:nucleotide-binding universal stress UspA family protein
MCKPKNIKVMFIKKILIPTDFSDCARQAAQMGIAMAKLAGAEILFLHLSEKGETSSHVPRTAGAPVGPSLGYEKNELNEWVKTAEREGVKAIPLLVTNAGNRKITDYVSSQGINMIVMGSHGATGIREWIIGSNTEGVIKSSTVPVLVIKQQPATETINHLLFASEFKDDLSEPLGKVLDFAGLWNARVHLLYINQEEDVDADVATQTLHRYATRYKGRITTENVADTNDMEFATRQFADQLKADMIALTTLERTGTIRLLSSSIAEKLANHEPMPVLVVPV